LIVNLIATFYSAILCLLQYLSKEDYGAANTYVAAKLIGFTSQTTAIEGKHDHVCV